MDTIQEPENRVRSSTSRRQVIAFKAPLRTDAVAALRDLFQLYGDPASSSVHQPAGRRNKTSRSF